MAPLSSPTVKSSPLVLLALLAGAVLLAGAGCSELPNDVGVRKHRSTAALTRKASHHPLFATWNDDPTAKGKPRILIDLTAQRAFFYRGETLIGKTNISSGKRAYETPPGKYRGLQKDANHVSNEYGVYENRLGGVVTRDC